MARTYKNRRALSQKRRRGGETMKRKCCEATMKGLHEWFVKLFEERGWMILAKERGMDDKVQVYKNSLQRLKQSLENALEDYKEEDRKRDIKIIWNNVNILIEDVNKNL